jgi:Xaa-Pro dipeptidase
MSKITEFQKVLKKKKIDFFIACNIDYVGIDYDMLYFSGFEGIGALVVPKNKKCFLIVPRDGIVKARKSGIKFYVLPKKKKLFEFIAENVSKNKIKHKRMGINKEGVNLLVKDYLKKCFKKSKLIDLRKELYKTREIKTKTEIKIIREGCRISDNILKKCFKEFKRFKREAEVMAFLEYESKKRGCGLAFPTIVASGNSSSEVHHTTEDVKLKKGFCIIDFGIRYKNYCTDTTRTIYLGKPTKKEIIMYDLLLKVQKNAIKNVKKNGKCSKLNENVKKGLDKYSKNFIHGLGHGIGVKIHELPNLTERSKDIFQEGQVFTIEPGVYFNNFGIRIEDDVLVSKNNVEVLTKIGKSLLIID